MLQLSHLTKTFGDKTLFEDVSMSMIAGERLGLVGKNGCGKSTLFKLILDVEHPDEGTITFARGYRVGHLEQHLHFTQPTVLAEACLGLPEDSKHEEYKAEIILGGLGFSEEDLHKEPALFSGGFQIRINLAKLLLSEPNLLLLDEPTNYLDIVSMRWLQSFLSSWKGELIIISHDRFFMDSVTTHTMLIHRGQITKVQGGTEKLYAQVELDEEVYEKTRQNEDKKRKEAEVFITRFRAQASKAAMVQSRIKALERMGQKEQLQDEATLDFVFRSTPHPGKVVAEIKELSFNYPDSPTLINNLNLIVGRNDRIGVIGKNGKGKSTLLKLIAGELAPKTGGVELSPNVVMGYFGQTNISRLDPKHTIADEIQNVNNNLTRTQVGAICGTMMFSGDDKDKKIGVLSGGEKSRVLLGKILARPSNMLLLDEPTNHLDMESIEALIQSLKTYDGAVIIVTHSEQILKEVTNRLVIFQGDAPRLFDHDYDYFLQKEGWGDEVEMSSSQSKSQAQSGKGDGGKSVPPVSAMKVKQRIEKKITNVEEKISELEHELKGAEEDLATLCEKNELTDVPKVMAQIEELKKKIDQGFEELANLSIELQEVSGVG